MTDTELIKLVDTYTKDIEHSKRHISRCKAEIEQYREMIKYYRDQRNVLWLEALIRFISKPFRGNHG